MKRNAKIITLLVCVILLTIGTVLGTMAYLKASQKVQNTFSVGDVKITLSESSDLDLKMIPGTDIAKDPTVMLAENSEPCWLFVKIQAENTENYITYAIADGWVPVSGQTNIYCREVGAADAEAGVSYAVIQDNVVSVPDTVTEAMLDAATGDNAPKLTFTAYAVQREGFDDAAKAWDVAAKLD